MCLSAAALIGCEQRSNFITETDPFVTVYVSTPAGGTSVLVERAKQFAATHDLQVVVVDGHFEATEYSLSLVRPDLNILANNVGKGSRTVVAAYAVGAPSDNHRRAISDYLCAVMLHGCP